VGRQLVFALYVTSEDPTAVSQGWQYRLRRVGDVVAREHLAVAINGTLFYTKSNRLFPMSGDLANAKEPVVADHTISHVWLDTSSDRCAPSEQRHWLARLAPVACSRK
jgi:hypothetical protein